MALLKIYYSFGGFVSISSASLSRVNKMALQEEWGGSLSASSSKQKLKDLSREMVKNLFIQADELEVSDSLSARKVYAKAERLQDAIDGKIDGIELKLPQRERLRDLDFIPDRVHLFNNNVKGMYRDLLVNKMVEAILTYEKEDRIQACIIFLSKNTLSIEETAVLLTSLQQREGDPSLEQECPNYLGIMECYEKIPRYRNVDRALQERMDQFLLDADRRVAFAKEQAIRDKYLKTAPCKLS